MKLTTQHGQLDLPQDFGLNMERNNPMFSDDGDASVPASLPSSPDNLAAIGHRERIDRADRYTNSMEAILTVGAVQKRGQLVIDTAHRREGIDASLAIDSSDLYAKANDKPLKDIFNDCDIEGVSKITFQSIEAAMDIMQDCYEGDDSYDFTLFPVAIAPYEQNNQTFYQFNNEEDRQHQLVYASRTVREGSVLMTVPQGYGIAPFLKLHCMLDRLFECLGYTVTSNCFDDSATDNLLARIVIVNNCSDALVRPVLQYADLVPSCKLGEFLEWLLAKFHVQPIVDSETKTAKIVMMETMLTETPDLDISDMAEGDWKVQLNRAKRIVLTPTNSIEGTAPANDSFDKLVEKYGGYVEADEWNNQSLHDCLVLRKATGQFYALNRDLRTGQQTQKLLGTNHFAYDRNNTDETEAFAQDDVMPLMMVHPNTTSPMAALKMFTVPFIGERIHFHTSYLGKEEDDKQEIIVAMAVSNPYFELPTTGTTQGFVPFASPHGGETGVTLPFNLTNFGLYELFWQRYNNLILNNATHVSGRVKYTLGQFLEMDMCRTKLCQGQKLLPVSASAQLNDRFGLSEVEMIIVKDYADNISDSPITPMPSNGLQWVMHVNDGPENAIDFWEREVVTDWINQHQVTYLDDVLTSYTYTVADITATQFLGVPTFDGQTIDLGNHTVELRVNGTVKYLENGQTHETQITGTKNISDTHCWFTAEPA